ncbi:MAG TPA: ferritin-like domain-containing protein [Allosphingosinicella sp.]|jgi:hypothetical protein
MDILSQLEEAPSGRIGPAGWGRTDAGARTADGSITIVLPFTEQGSDTLAGVYEKATRNQWHIDDVDWSQELDPANPLGMHDVTIPLAATPIWDRMDEKEKSTVRQHLQAWHLSQILHGERASLLCAGKIVMTSEDPAEKLCAAMQAADEARHVKVYSRLLSKVGPEVDISPSVDRLLYNVLQDNEPGIVSLGVQILIEGLALAFFKSLSAYSSNSLVRNVIELVVRDEARHFAAGQLGLAAIHKQLSSAELAMREEYVAEACVLLDTYLFADELWEPLGLKKQECMELTRSSKVNRSMHRALFRSIVPAVRGIGLLGPRTTKAFEQLGVLDYAAFPST